MWPAIPLIAPSLFICDGKLLWRPILGYLALIPVTALFLTFIAPAGSWFFFRQHFAFWGLDVQPRTRGRARRTVAA
jgi:hypothetical protein